MREILFRGKRIGDNEWVYGFYVFVPKGRFSEPEHMIQTIANDGRMGLLVDVDPATVGQYTGLCDKNGKKIFEGDVVKVKDALDWGTIKTFSGSVGFGDASFRLETDVSLHYRWQDYDCEVISTIHDKED